MLKKFLKWGDPNRSDDPGYSASLERVVGQLGEIPEDQRAFVGSVALLLSRVADADLEITETEKKRIQAILEKELQLTTDLANRITTLAIEANAEDGLDGHIILRKMVEVTTAAQRADVMRSLLLLASDEFVTTEEDQELRLVAKGLRISESDYLTIRSEYREHLAWFQIP